MMRAFLITCLIAVAGAAMAIDSDGGLEDPVLQARFEKLTWELRCLVCQNQNIADSNADLAKDLRAQVKEMLLAGRSDEEILTYMTDRYGDFVLYRPRFTPKNWLLWGAPAIFLLFGAAVLVRVVRKQASRSGPGDPDDDDATNGAAA